MNFNIMKIIIFSFVILTFIGCEKTTRTMDITKYNIPDDLKDCKMYELSNGFNHMYVMRCTNSTTSLTYQEGKISRTTITIDGVTYVKK